MILKLHVMVLLFSLSLHAQASHEGRNVYRSITNEVFGETDITFENSSATTVPSFDVTDASNASPIVVTTSAAHGVVNTEWVVIEDVTGNTAANGIFEAASVTSTTMALVGSTGNGAYIANGVLGGFKTVAGTWLDGSLNNFTASAAGVLTYTFPSPRRVIVFHTESTNLVTDPGNPVCHYAILHNDNVLLKSIAERNLPSILAFGSSNGFALLQLTNGDTLQLMLACVEPSGGVSYDVMVDHAALVAFAF